METFQTGAIGDPISFAIMHERQDGTVVPMVFTDAVVRLAIQDPVTGRTAVHPATVVGNVVSIISTANTFVNAGTHRWQVAASFPGGYETRSPVGSVMVRESLV